MLKALGVRFVVAPAAWALVSAGSPLVERARFDDGVVYEVLWTPDVEAALAGLAEPEAPPLPGVAPFAAGEEAEYQVTWVGELPAGRGTLGARAVTDTEAEKWPGAVWRFEGAASTASWVSRFFEARDRFISLATDDFRPLAQTRDIDEGARRLTRAYVYDFERRQVRSGSDVEDALAPDAQASPLMAGSRDAVTALFYLRTLPLTPGAEIAIPVNDAGRHVIARVRVEQEDAIRGPGGEVRAQRLSVALERRLERRQAMELTLWISADARRVPLRLDLAAGFGRVRVELVDYRP